MTPTRVLFALCVYLYCISGVVVMAQNFDTFFFVDIRNTSAASGDVIYQGQSTFSWTNNEAYQYPGQTLPTFYAYLNGSNYPDLGGYDASVLLGSPIQFSVSPLTFSVYRRDDDAFTNYTAIQISQTRCTDESGGRHLIVVEFRNGVVHVPNSNITFYRWCKAPALNIGSAVGLSDIYTLNRTVAVPFSTDNSNVSATMYLWASPLEPYWSLGQVIPGYTITATSNDTTMAVPTVGAGDNNNDTLTVGPNGYVDVYFAYGCLPNVTGNVTFTMEVTYGYVQTLTLSWWKVCGAVSDSNPPPVNVYSCASKDSTCLVADRQNGTFANWQNGYSFYQQPQRLTFYVEYVFPTGPAHLECKISVSDEFPAVATTQNIPGDSLDLLVGTATPIPLFPICKSPDFAQTQVTINCNTTVSNRPTNYTPIQYFYNYQCVKPLIDLSTKLVGTPDLVSQSNPQNGVSGEPGNMFNPQLVIDGTDTVFYAKLSSNAQNFSALYITLNVTSAPSGMKVNIDNSQISTGTLSSSANNMLSIPISFSCSSGGIVTFELKYGWDTTAVFYVQTNCVKSSGGGLGGAAIFFIVFFVLLFVFCVAGSLFNYHKRGKRGWPVIPGYETCQGCYDKAMGPNRYTPQMDYERTFKTGGGGYGSYGTTSGDSYQSNL